MKAALKIKHALALWILLFQLPTLTAQENCNDDQGTIKIHLPITPSFTEVGFDVPNIWNGYGPRAEDIEIPNGRPIYALIVSGYASNLYLDEIMLYNFVTEILSKGGYVHYAWWNNLLFPYMEEPLHHWKSHPGHMNGNSEKFRNLENVQFKALPGEDYQFVDDAIIFLQEIRKNNPEAIIVVAGHSMGGGAVIHLATELKKTKNYIEINGEMRPVQIDILAPIDPVGNRNIPFAGKVVGNRNRKDMNWTRWRVSRDRFQGYKKTILDQVVQGCIVTGEYLATYNEAKGIPGYNCDPYAHYANIIKIGANIKHLFHRYQQEYSFPFDYSEAYHFAFDDDRVINDYGIKEQTALPMKGKGVDDIGGWPKRLEQKKDTEEACCLHPDEGVGWKHDGHGEIIGYRGPVDTFDLGDGFPVPLGVRLRTSLQCGTDPCNNDQFWPSRTIEIPKDVSLGDDGTVRKNGNEFGDGSDRKERLMTLERKSIKGEKWASRPTSPDLCLVSDTLKILFKKILPDKPVANAGEDQVVECTGQDGAMVTLDGSASERAKCYTWKIDEEGENPMTLEGETVSVTLSLGTHFVQLIVTDKFNREASDSVFVDVVDTTPPELTVSLDPYLLWPPNHKFVDITATLEAMDLCGDVNTILYSIVASEADDVIGSGNTSPDIAGADFGTEDTMFKLRAERSGKNHKRVYTVTYKATDDSGNSTFAWDEVIVENPANVKGNPHQNGNWLVEGNARNIPNPFSSRTNFKFYLAERSKVKITVYDLRGREVAAPFNGVENEGAKSISFDGRGLSPGIYIFSVATDKNIMMNKMVVKR